jgi:hypothetical protein
MATTPLRVLSEVTTKNSAEALSAAISACASCGNNLIILTQQRVELSHG